MNASMIQCKNKMKNCYLMTMLFYSVFELCNFMKGSLILMHIHLLLYERRIIILSNEGWLPMVLPKHFRPLPCQSKIHFSCKNCFVIQGVPELISHVKGFFCMISIPICRIDQCLIRNNYTCGYCINFSFQKSDVPSQSYREICKTTSYFCTFDNPRLFCTTPSLAFSQPKLV